MPSLTLAALLSTAPAALAGEGMWLPEQLPALGGALTEAGVALDPAALADLQGDIGGAVVSLGGCSASFVSPDGLIVTNHHCAYRTLQHHSRPEADILSDGFLAEDRADELPAVPGSFVYVTTAQRDVSAEVLGKVPKRASDADRARLVDQRMRGLVDACEAPGVRCRVAAMAPGERYVLVTQLELRDVRLVYAPALGVGNFGGEVDNWMWPRHTGDFAFLRAWVGPDGRPADRADGNVPYRPEHWLRAAEGHREPGDAVLVVGYPGRTSRWETAAELEADAAYRIPESIRLGRALIGLLEGESEAPARALANYPRIRRLANAVKKQEGVLETVGTGSVTEARHQREAAIAAAVAADRKRARAGDPVAAIARVVEAQRRTERRDLVMAWLGRASPLMEEAVELWRMAEERVRPDLEREEGYRDRDLERFALARERAQSTLDPASDRATLRFWLTEAAALPPDQRIAAVDAAVAAADGDTDAARIEALLDRLYAGTRLHELATRRDLGDATLAELRAAGDPMLALAGELAPLMAEQRASRDAYAGAMLRLRPPYFAALRDLGAGPLYPDANGTLRVTFGRIDGYSPEEAVRYEPRTSVPGLLAKATGERPFDPPEALLEAAKAVPATFVDPALGGVPVAFLSTCDTTGGNSGSATLDAAGRLSGLLFDGTLDGVASDLAFEPSVTRSIHVDWSYVRWVMDEVDHADVLLREMGVQPMPGGATSAERAASPPGLSSP